MRRVLRLRSIAVLLVILPLLYANAGLTREQKIELRVNQLLAKMTLEEKVGQLNQYNFDSEGVDKEIAAGRVGSLLNATGAEQVNRLQKIAVEKSRLHIPILFGYDVIHGYRTIFPIPLGIASSWDTSLTERMARTSASEASAAGVRWTFSPMVDIARDPRWGRIAEGAGEDPYLGSQISAAYVRGYQGKDLSSPENIAACAKHFVAYGAAEGGRDYNSVDMSERKLREVYLPPFKAAVDAGAATFMSSFNTLNGVPASANPFTLRQVLKKEWAFRGFVVSDWDSIGELINHGVAADNRDAAELAFRAGVDMDMTTAAYVNHLPELVRSGEVTQAQLDDAVRRVLRIKFELGLFDNPYTDASKESGRLLTNDNLALAREVAAKSMVLLKNDKDVLPFSDSVSSIAVIGPLADSKADMLGSWFGRGEAKDVVTVLEGVRARAKSARVLYSAGGSVTKSTEQEIADAVATTKQTDVTLLVIGERGDMSGEAKSRADLDLPGDQEKLLEAVVATGKPVAVVVMSGRPLTLTAAAEHAPAMLEAWFPGVQAGNAVADVVFGDVNPGGKLPASFPRTLGQVPIYYSSLNTGRPLLADGNRTYKSAYIDAPNTPLYPFGFGLSYTTFEYSDLQVSKPAKDGSVRVTVNVKNTGKRAGDEVVQLYTRELVASVSRPVKELKAFQRITLAPGEAKQVAFTIAAQQLAFWNESKHFAVEAGDYSVFVGSDSNATLKASFTVGGESLNAKRKRSQSPKAEKRPVAGATATGPTGE